MHLKPKKRMEDDFKEKCRKANGEVTETMGSITCGFEEDEDMSYPKRKITLNKSSNQAHLVTAGGGADLENPEVVELEEPNENFESGVEQITGERNAPNKLIVHSGNDEVEVIGNRK